MGLNETAVGVDREAMTHLRDAVGQSTFDELFEDAIFEVTERIARIEHLCREGNLAEMGSIAHNLVSVAGQVGLSGISEIATSLEVCCRDGATVSAQAIASRLVRVGEASLVAAAEISVDLSQQSKGRHAV